MQPVAAIKKYKLHHLLFWLAFFCGWYYLRFQDYSSHALAFKITVVKVLDLALLVYFTNLILIPKLLYRKQYFFFSIVYIALIFFSTAWKISILGSLMHMQTFSILSNFKLRLYDNIIPHFLLVSTGVAIKLVSDYVRGEQRMAEISKERLAAELNFLKSQVNPHFLFNSLNAVYFLIDKSNKEARDALHQFSEMLRYQLYECGDGKIAIEKELKYLQDYVDLQKLRKDDNYSVRFNSAENMGTFSIEPLLLIPFVENSFKHLSNNYKGWKNEILINAAQLNGEFIFSVSNTVDYHNLDKDTFGGIGLRNVKRRLELLYPGKHELNITEAEGWFNVNFKLKIDENTGV
ncbi:MAG: hypothetical protein JWN76_3692 [Chitinophagaceae bacterium]|nr:hypothetical protein [Chitinophagaceae bacterium]